MKRMSIALTLVVSLCGFLNGRLSAHFRIGLALQETLGAEKVITTDVISATLVKLADDKYEGRGAGYQGERLATQYIAEEFKKIGLLKLPGQRDYFQEFKFHPIKPGVPWEMMSSRNVLGLIEGGDSTLKNEVVVI